MFTPALENIINFYKNIEITIIGSHGSLEFIKNHPKVVKTVAINSKKKFSFGRYINLGFFDVYFSFRGSIRARLGKLIINAKNKYQFDYSKFPNRHQVEKYVDFVNDSLNANFIAGNLLSYQSKPENKKAVPIVNTKL